MVPESVFLLILFFFNLLGERGREREGALKSKIVRGEGSQFC